MHRQTAAENHPTAVLTPSPTPAAPWRLAAVEALPNYRLRVRFNDGQNGTVNLAPMILSENAGVFAALKDEVEFARAGLVYGAVTWPCGLDLAPDAMHAAIIAGNGHWTPQP